jgi:hypothetical protein
MTFNYDILGIPQKAVTAPNTTIPDLIWGIFTKILNLSSHQKKGIIQKTCFRAIIGSK